MPACVGTSVYVCAGVGQGNKEEDCGEAQGTKLQNVCFRLQGFF